MIIERATGLKYWDYLSKALWSKVAEDTQLTSVSIPTNP